MIKLCCKVPKTEAAEPGSARWHCRVRVCLVSNGVGDLEEPTLLLLHGKQPHMRPSCGAVSSVFEAFLPQRKLSARSSAYARTPKRFNPHPYQTGSKTQALDQLLILLPCDARKFHKDTNSHRCPRLSTCNPS